MAQNLKLPNCSQLKFNLFSMIFHSERDTDLNRSKISKNKFVIYEKFNEQLNFYTDQCKFSKHSSGRIN